MKKTVLEANGLSVDRGGRRVLSEVSFSVDEGEVFALLGGNGRRKVNNVIDFPGLYLSLCRLRQH